MRTKKLELKKLNITKLKSLHMIMGGSEIGGDLIDPKTGGQGQSYVNNCTSPYDDSVDC